MQKKKKDLEIKNKMTVSEGIYAREREIYTRGNKTHTYFITPPKLIRKSKLKLRLLVKDDRVKNPKIPIKNTKGVLAKVWTHLDGEGRRETAAFWMLDSRWVGGS